MRATRFITTVEMHTCGEPFRIVTGGMPKIKGGTILQKRTWLQRDADEFRRAMMLEPRGHADMYGGFVTEPVSADADLGVVFMQNADYSPHCGHGIIGLATAAVELGWVERTTPETRVGIDAPCGFIEAFVEWDGAHVANVRFVNVPSFVWQLDVTVTTPTFGPVTGDIAYGGAFYLYLDGGPFGVGVREAEAGRLKALGMEVKDAANAAFSVIHPEIPEISGVYGAIISGAPRHPGSTQANACVFANGELDRSPTGSGTAGRIAQLHARGLFQPGETLVNESIIGSVFKGRILQGAEVAGRPAVIPEIQGDAFICGFGNWMIDERDPLSYGFELTGARD